MNTLLFILILGVLLRLARRGWMGYQVRPAVIRTFELESAADIRVEKARFFCGRDSMRAAFLSTLSTRFYQVWWQAADGTEEHLDLEIHFHPLWGTLRKIEVMNLIRANEAGYDNLS